MSRIIYLGLLLPLQLLFCGSLIYLSTYPSWLRWGAYLNPMHFYLAAFFINEFHENSDTFPSSSTHHYDDLRSQYGYQTSLLQSIFLMIVLGYVYKMLWLLSLKYRELWTLSTLPFKKVYRAAKKKMKKMMRAGLRFSKRRSREGGGGGGGGGGGDGYVLDHSTESYEEWRSDEDEQQQVMSGEEGGGGGGGGRRSEGRRRGKEKKRKSLGEEMFVREDGLLLFGMMNQPTQQPPTPTQSHHSVLSALYRPEYLQSPSSLSASSTSPSSSQPPLNSSPSGASPNPSAASRNSKNRIVVSKSQRGSHGSSGAGGGSAGGQESTGGSETLHSSLRI
jgi:hypothetical protein